MNILLKITASVFLSFALSCDSAKSAAETSATADTNNKAMQEQLISEGYSPGTVKLLKNSECTYIIVDEKTNVQFDPINMDDAKFADFKSEGAKIFYKYQPLRRMNRCTEAQPISIIDIKKRED